MGAHTGGRWTPSKQGNGQWFVLADSGYPVCRVARWEKENDAADARLIAAAPELLEAAKNLLEHWAEIEPLQQFQAMRAAIAKAEGRS